jgi:hypothetical protein
MLDQSQQLAADWLTYEQLAERLDTTPRGTAQIARRRQRARMFRDNGVPKVTLVLLPPDFVKPVRNVVNASSRSSSDALTEAVQVVVGPLAAALERQERTTKALQAALDTARSEAAAAQLEVAKAMYDLERGAGERAAFEEQIDDLQKLLRAARQEGSDRGMWQATAAAHRRPAAPAQRVAPSKTPLPVAVSRPASRTLG